MSTSYSYAFHSLLVQLPKGCEDYFINVEGRKGSYTANGNTAQQQSWVEPVTWCPRSRQEEPDDLRLEQNRDEAELEYIQGLVMDRHRGEFTIRWLGRWPMRKEGMKDIVTEDLENMQLQVTNIVIF